MISKLDLAHVTGGAFGGLHPLTDDELPPPSHKPFLEPDDPVNTHKSWLHPSDPATVAPFTRCDSIWGECKIYKKPE